MHAGMYECMDDALGACMHAHIYLCTYTHKCVHIHTYIGTFSRMYEMYLCKHCPEKKVHMYVCMCIHVCTQALLILKTSFICMYLCEHACMYTVITHPENIILR